MLLLECITGPVSEHPSTANVLTGPKHCRSPQEKTFVLFSHHSGIDRAWKRPPIHIWNPKITC